MEFQKERVYSAVNADELRVGSKVIIGDTIERLKSRVHNGTTPLTLSEIKSDSYAKRFRVEEYTEPDSIYNFVYLISEPEEKKLKWTDLKVGDIVRRKDGRKEAIITMIDMLAATNHVCIGGYWKSDSELVKWEKVER